MLRFQVLGPVELTVDGRILTGLAPRHRAMLAYLLLNAGRVCSAERITDAIWGLEPPDTARAQIHAGMTAIRRVIREASAEQVIATKPAGYVALPEPGQLDLDDFTRRVADTHASADELRAALALWRGDALADLSADYVTGERSRLGDKRLSVFERLMDAELALGRHEQVLDELTAHVTAHPLREKTAGQLVLALHRVGRQADALAAARAFRTQLADEQGLDPSRAFLSLEQTVLRDEPKSAPVVTRSVNFLPYDIPDFAGRGEELDHLLEPQLGSTVTIDGMAGIGKTALAVHAAHRVAERFPDGQLFLDLQAHTAGREPVTTEAALEMLLRMIGTPAERIPSGAAERGALWRTELADRKVVVVLDNAIDTDQVRPLLPGASASMVLITSRRRLINLDGARALSVDLLPPDDSIDLFSRIVGARAAAEPIAVLDVLQLCGFLPLAVRIAAARLHHRPRWTVEYLAGRLRDERRRLTELSTAERGVAAAFALSYHHLDPDQQRMFRLLGLHRGRDIEACAAAALADMPVEDAEMLLEDLLDAHVVAQREPGRYTFHDLLREHARATASTDEAAESRAAAQSRLLDHYLHTARAAVDLLFGYSAEHRPALAGAAVACPSIDTAAHAAQWLDAERDNLIAVVGDPSPPAYVADMATTLRPYLDGDAHHSDGIRVHTAALQASRHLDDPIGVARALTDLGWTCWRQGYYEHAAVHSEQAVAVAGTAGDQYNEARALNTLGNVAWRRRDHGAAQACFEKALALSRASGNRVGEAHVLGNLGRILESTGNCTAAGEHLDAALALHRTLGNQRGEALVLNYLGQICRSHDRLDEARDHHRRAGELYRALGNFSDEATALNGLGETECAAGDPGQAITDHEAALALADEAGNRPEQARAHDGLARAHCDLGHLELARAHAEQALTHYVALDVPEAEDIRVFLATVLA